MDHTVRVRYAPSPTGAQHLGGMRTALLNYLYARRAGGRFVLRIEDTDVARSEARYEQSLYDALAWLGLDWDEGPDIGGPYAPYRQSERGELYRQAARQLLEQGSAYCCYCSVQELRAERERAVAAGQPPRYSGRCRDPQVREALARAGRPLVLRFRVPEGEQIVFHDLVRREVRFATGDLDDFAFYSAADPSLSEGRALYNLAVVVDDHAMAISDVLRGEEHLPNTPRQILIYRALGYPVPRFGHLALILSPGGEKMSKRAGDTAIEHYRAAGYLPEALLGYLATLGWSPGGDAETLTLAQLVARFDARRLSANPSIFDAQRLLAANKRALRAAEGARVADLLRPRLERAYGRWECAEGTAHTPEAWYAILVRAAQDEAATLEEMVALAEFAYLARVTRFTPPAQQALAGERAREVLARCRDTLSVEALATPAAAKDYFRDLRYHFRDAASLRGREVMFPVRAALTGTLVGPCLGVVGSLLGLARCRQRLEEV